ncbi:MAG: immune inhibitor A [Anaerolineae bacterium]|nr:immune inhibitor A [Thermoflexales bacterium]MDW8406434.1 immune inhibitor A [Anaerolineae bacterium]
MTAQSRNGWVAFLVGLTIACLCAWTCSGTFIVTWTITRALSAVSPPRAPSAMVTSTATDTVRRSTVLPTTDSAALLSVTPAPDQVRQLELLKDIVLPKEDLADLAVRFRGVSPAQARVRCNTPAKEYELGARRAFTLSNQDTNTQFRIDAELRYKTQNLYMWVEVSPNAPRINQTNLRQAAEQFDRRILPTTRAFFGEEARPGVDCDPRLNILHATGIGATVGGYFSSPDGYPRAVRPDSNEAELFVVNAEPGYNGANPGSASYMSTLAHELQHMISHNQTHSPELWLEEGASQLAERLNGYADEVGTVYAFANKPETQLNTWSETSAGENSAHYGGAYLFWAYLYDRFGHSVVRAIARTPERSTAGIMRTLEAQGVVNPDTGQPYEFPDLFADFVIANYLGRQQANGDASNRFNYADTDVPPMSIQADLNNADFPFHREAKINQFGTHYYELRSNAPLQLTFKGAGVVRFLPTAEADGAFWWSNRADASNPRLTREIDLTQAREATLRFRAWYRIERDYDYAYVSVSTDGGKSWEIQATPSCTRSDPNGANLGCGYTGSSGGGDTPTWIEETVDLGRYVGRTIHLRFELVTDAGVNREGLAIDNIQIPEIGWRDDASTPAGWRAEGFAHIRSVTQGAPSLPQHWRVQIITFRNDGRAQVERLSLAPDNTATVRLALGRSQPARRAVIAISPVTLITTQPARYRLTIAAAD